MSSVTSSPVEITPITAGEFIRRCRGRISGIAVADRAGYSHGYLYQIEAGREVPDDTIGRILIAIGELKAERS